MDRAAPTGVVGESTAWIHGVVIPLIAIFVFGSWASASFAAVVDLAFDGSSLPPGWSLLSDPENLQATPLAQVGPTGRSFQTGPAGNDHALFIVPAAGVDEKFFQGAVWQVDAGAAVEVPATSVVAVETESFSDVASNFSQWYKIDVSAGVRGNGRSTEGGFHSERAVDDLDDHTGETHLTTNTNFSTDPDGDNQQKVQLQGLGLGSEFHLVNSNWSGAATSDDLSRSYVNRFVFRHQLAADGQTPLGTRIETVGEAASYISSPLVGNGPSLPPLFMPTRVDRVTVQLLRHQGVPDTSVSQSLRRFDVLAPDTVEASAKVGIRSVRVSVTGRTDFDVDFVVTDSGDGEILTSNLGDLGARAQGVKLFFDGDADGDGLVTASSDGALLLKSLSAKSSASSDGAVTSAKYNPTTGEVDIRATGVARITLQSEAGWLARLAESDVRIDEFGNAGLVDEPSRHDRTWFALDNELGGGGLARFVGQVVAPGTPVGDLTLEYQLRGGSSIPVNLVVIAEPAVLPVMSIGIMATWLRPRRWRTL